MPDKNNKVKFNLKNAHYALLTIAEDGAVSYAAPTPMPGSFLWMQMASRRTSMQTVWPTMSSITTWVMTAIWSLP